MLLAQARMYETRNFQPREEIPDGGNGTSRVKLYKSRDFTWTQISSQGPSKKAGAVQNDVRLLDNQEVAVRHGLEDSVMFDRPTYCWCRCAPVLRTMPRPGTLAESGRSTASCSRS